MKIIRSTIVNIIKLLYIDNKHSVFVSPVVYKQQNFNIKQFYHRWTTKQQRASLIGHTLAQCYLLVLSDTPNCLISVLSVKFTP